MCSPIYFQFQVVIAKILFGEQAAINVPIDMQNRFAVFFYHTKYLILVNIIADGFDQVAILILWRLAFIAQLMPEALIDVPF